MGSFVSQPPSEPRFFRGQDWHIPFRTWFDVQPFQATIPRGRRSATVTAANYRSWGQSLYLSTNVGANQVYELADSALIYPHVTGLTTATTVWDADFVFCMTMNQSTLLGGSGGEMLQGFGIGSMLRDTPWLGQFAPAGTGTVVHLRYNFTTQKFELFAANDGSDLGNKVDLITQPNFAVDIRIPEFRMEWNATSRHMVIRCNGVVVHDQDMAVMLPNGGVFGDSSQIAPIMFLTNGSNAAAFHTEAGYYMPRFWQPARLQPVL